jgi:hypothetical protein
VKNLHKKQRWALPNGYLFSVRERKKIDSECNTIFLRLFQVLTQEDWNIVLFLGMQRTSHWAALYFVALMTFGNYVLFNLLVAILVEGFSSQVSPKIVLEIYNCYQCLWRDSLVTPDVNNDVNLGLS